MNQNITLSTCAFGANAQNSNYYARQFEMAMKAGFSGFELTLYPDSTVPAIIEAVHQTCAPVIAIHGVGKGNWFADTPEEQKHAALESARYLEYFAEFAPSSFVDKSIWLLRSASGRLLYEKICTFSASRYAQIIFSI